jgi:hypothetical protein
VRAGPVSTPFDAFGADSPLAALFIPAAIAWTVFTLQDGVLTGLRAALWVPVDNISYGLLKLILLVLLAPVSPRFGLFISWMVPAILLLVPINLVIFKQLIPRHIQLTKSAAAPLNWHEFSKYVGSNYFGSLFALSASRLLPTLVVAVAGAAAGAYFYLAWAISDSLKLVTTQMATSLTVEGALDDRSVAANGHAFLRLLFGLFVPLIGVLLVAAPALLRLSGEAYAVEGAAVLRLLSLAVIPSLFITWYLSIARVRHQLLEILCVEGFLALLILGLSYLLLQAYGMIGVGIASVIAATIVAAALLPQLRSVLLPVRRPGPNEWTPDSAA